MDIHRIIITGSDYASGGYWYKNKPQFIGLELDVYERVKNRFVIAETDFNKEQNIKHDVKLRLNHNWIAEGDFVYLSASNADLVNLLKKDVDL